MRYGSAALAALCLLALAAAPAQAQRTVVGVSYDWSMPMGDAGDFVDNDSWLGFTMDVRYFADRNARSSLGATFGYYEFYHMDPFASTIQFGATAVTGQQYRHAFSIPLMLNFTGYFGSDQYKPRPYIGLNGGVSYIKQTVDVGIYTLTSDAWVVSSMPEIGVVIPRGRNQINLHARYHVPFGSDNLFSNGGSGLSFQYLSIGVGFMGRP